MRNLPPAVKNLLIVNGAMLLLAFILEHFFSINFTRIVALHYFESEHFQPYQFITHMFMHADFFHLLFNMYALWLFGKVLETVWGTKRFLIYYLFTGLGAAALHTAISWYEFSTFKEAADAVIASPSPQRFADFANTYSEYFNRTNLNNFIANWFDNPQSHEMKAFAISQLEQIVTSTINIPTVGASGAVFGVLLAFGMMFPNTELYLMFVPIPIKAKYFVIGYGAIELIYGVSNIPGDNVAHFAHLGGMIFGFILIKIWNKGKTNFLN